MLSLTFFTKKGKKIAQSVEIPMGRKIRQSILQEKRRLAKEKEDNPKYKCECGAEIKNQTSVIKKHKKTLKHKNWVLENK